MEYVDTLILIATIVAIIYGPIKAVKITRQMDREAQAIDRKSSVYRDLMRTRAIRLDPVHVSALNLVEVEFYGDEKVSRAYHEYVRHLGSPMPEAEQQGRFFEERLDLFVTMMFEIGNSLGYKFDKRDLERRAYSPQGWETDTLLQRRNAALLGEVLEGRRGIPISNFAGANNPFPPPPEE